MDYPWEEDEQYIADSEWYDQAAPEVVSGGCLVGALPLVAVIAVSCLLAFAALNLTSPVIAISVVSVTENPQAAQLTVDANPAESETSDQEEKTSGKLARLFTPEVLYWEDAILKWAKKNDLDPNLVATVMQIESCGDPQAESHAGAKGLFQVMPFHFSASENPFDPATNATRGMAYLVKALAARNSDARLALASYNGGISGASRPESQWAAETQRYAYWGSGIYTDAANGKKNSNRLQEWLSAGGAGLCAQANQRLGLNP
jgi:soluble lytic murein transglycosylase-like protein